jgi:hypothetical protein
VQFPRTYNAFRLRSGPCCGDCSCAGGGRSEYGSLDSGRSNVSDFIEVRSSLMRCDRVNEGRMPRAGVSFDHAIYM